MELTIIQNFIKAIKRAKDAEFDGIELHAAHGYLLHEFLSPHTNRRNDKWGGSTEKRFRILLEIIEGAREIVGDFPIFVKFSAYESKRKGIKIEESIKIAHLLQESGVDCIEVSCGGVGEGGFNSVRVTEIPVDAAVEMVPFLKDLPSIAKSTAKLAMPFIYKTFEPINNYNIAASETIKSEIDIPVIVCGGIRNIDDIKSIINKKQADFVSMSRPFICEPGIVKKFKLGKQKESRCINCGYCLFGCMSSPVRCFCGKL